MTYMVVIILGVITIPILAVFTLYLMFENTILLIMILCLIVGLDLALVSKANKSNKNNFEK